MTRQRENLQILLNNMGLVKKLQNAQADSAGQAEKKFNDSFAKSTEAKINDFKHAIEMLNQSLINSEFINGGLGLLKGFIDGITFISKHSVLAIGLIGTSLGLVFQHLSAGSSTLKKIYEGDFKGFFSGVKKGFGELRDAVKSFFGMANSQDLKVTETLKKDVSQRVDSDYAEATKEKIFLQNQYRKNAQLTGEAISEETLTEKVNAVMSKDSALSKNYVVLAEKAIRLETNNATGAIAEETIMARANKMAMQEMGESAVIAGNEIKTLLISTGIGIAIMVAFELVSKGIGLVIDSINKNIEAKKKEEEQDRKNIKLYSEHSNEINKLADRYTYLTQKENLNTKQKKELLDTTQKLSKIMPGAIAYFDSHGKAVLKDADEIQKLIKNNEKLLEIQRKLDIDKADKNLASNTEKINNHDETINNYKNKNKRIKSLITNDNTSEVDKSRYKEILKESEEVIDKEVFAKEKLITSNQKTKQSILELLPGYQKLEDKQKEYINKVVEMSSGFNSSKSIMDFVSKFNKEDFSGLDKFQVSYDKAVKAYKNSTDTINQKTNFENAKKAYKNLVDYITAMLKNAGVSTATLNKIIDKIPKVTNIKFSTDIEKAEAKLEGFKITTESMTSSVDKFKEKISALKGALNEYNSETGVTQDTISNLVSLFPTLADKVTGQAGAYKLSKEAVDDLLKSQTKQVEESITGNDKGFASNKKLLESLLKMYNDELKGFEDKEKFKREALKQTAEYQASINQGNKVKDLRNDMGLDKNDKVINLQKYDEYMKKNPGAGKRLNTYEKYAQENTDKYNDVKNDFNTDEEISKARKMYEAKRKATLDKLSSITTAEKYLAMESTSPKDKTTNTGGNEGTGTPNFISNSVNNKDANLSFDLDNKIQKKITDISNADKKGHLENEKKYNKDLAELYRQRAGKYETGYDAIEKIINSKASSIGNILGKSQKQTLESFNKGKLDEEVNKKIAQYDKEYNSLEKKITAISNKKTKTKADNNLLKEYETQQKDIQKDKIKKLTDLYSALDTNSGIAEKYNGEIVNSKKGQSDALDANISILTEQYTKAIEDVFTTWNTQTLKTTKKSMTDLEFDLNNLDSDNYSARNGVLKQENELLRQKNDSIDASAKKIKEQITEAKKNVTDVTKLKDIINKGNSQLKEFSKQKVSNSKEMSDNSKQWWENSEAELKAKAQIVIDANSKLQDKVDNKINQGKNQLSYLQSFDENKQDYKQQENVMNKLKLLEEEKATIAHKNAENDRKNLDIYVKQGIAIKTSTGAYISKTKEMQEGVELLTKDIENQSNTWYQSKQAVNDYAKQIAKLREEQIGSITDFEKDLQDALKKSHEAKIKSIEEEMETEDTAHNKKLKDIDDESKAQEDAYNAKIKEINREYDLLDRKDELKQMQDDKQATQDQVDALKLGTDPADIAKRHELEKQLTEQDYKITKYNRDNEKTDRVNALQDSIDGLKDNADKTKAQYDVEYENYKELKQAEIDREKDMTEEVANATEARQLLESKNFAKIYDLLGTYEPKYQELGFKLTKGMGQNMEEGLTGYINNILGMLDKVKTEMNIADYIPAGTEYLHIKDAPIIPDNTPSSLQPTDMSNPQDATGIKKFNEIKSNLSEIITPNTNDTNTDNTNGTEYLRIKQDKKPIWGGLNGLASGGLILEPQLAILGEEGKERVLNAKATSAFDMQIPSILNYINNFAKGLPMLIPAISSIPSIGMTNGGNDIINNYDTLVRVEGSIVDENMLNKLTTDVKEALTASERLHNIDRNSDLKRLASNSRRI